MLALLRNCWFAAALAIAPIICAADDTAPKKTDSEKPAAEATPASRLRITISKETTFFTEPLTKEGFVDYAAALNKRIGKGVTPESNAAVVLVRAFGPRGSGTATSFFETLGVAAPPEEGNYFVGFPAFLDGRGIKQADPKLNALFDEQTRACTGPWVAKDHPEIAEWLAVNEKPLAVIGEAIQRPRFFAPLIEAGQPGSSETLIGVLLPWFSEFREVARALTARAMLRLGEEKADAAWTDLMAGHRLARLAGQSPTILGGLVAFAMEATVAVADSAWLNVVRPDSKRALQCLRDLDALPPISPMVDKIDLFERCCFHDAVLGIASGRVGESDEDLGDFQKLTQKIGLSLINWNVTMRIGNEWFDRQTKAMRLPSYTMRQAAFEELEQELKQLFVESKKVTSILGNIFGGDPGDGVGRMMGNTLVGLLIPATAQTRRAEDRIVQRIRNLRVAFALQACRADEGAFPESLDALAPKYLAEVPQDLFGAKPLTYKADGDSFLLYSIGENARDDDGASYEDRPRGDDLTIRIPASKE